MDKSRIGGGLLAGVGICAPWVAQMMGLTLPAPWGWVILGLCGIAAVGGLLLLFWPSGKAKTMKEEKRAGTTVVRLRGNSHGNKFYGVHGHNVDSAFEIEDSASDNEATDVRLTRDRPDKDLA